MEQWGWSLKVSKCCFRLRQGAGHVLLEAWLLADKNGAGFLAFEEEIQLMTDGPAMRNQL